MPYAIRKVGNKYSVVNKASGHVHSKTTKEKAMRQFKLLEGLEHGTIHKGQKQKNKGKTKGTLLK